MRNFGQFCLFWCLAILWLACCHSLVRGSGAVPDSTRILQLLDRSEALARSQPDSALFFARQARDGAREIGHRKFEGMALQYISRFHRIKGELEQAVEILEECEMIFKEIHDFSNLAYVRLDLAKTNKLRGNYPASIKYYTLGKSYLEEVNDSSGLSLVYNRLGNLYTDLKQYEKAIEFHKQSLAINTALDFKIGITANWNNISSAYQYMNESDSALGYLEKALALKQEVKDKQGMVPTLMNLGVVYINLKELDKAEDHLNRSLALARQFEMWNEEADCYINLSYLFIEKGMPEKAIEYGKKAEKMLDKEGYPHSKLFAYKKLSNAYEENGEYKLALAYMKKHINLNDSLFPSDIAVRMVESEAKLEAEKQKAEIELLQSRDALNQLELEVQDRQKWWFIALLGLLLILAIVLYSRYRLKLRTNRELRALDATKSRFFANLSHEFRTPLTLIIGPLEKLLAEGKDQGGASSGLEADGNSSHDNRHAFSRILRNAQHLLNLNEQLLDLAKIESGVLEVSPVHGDVIAYLRPVVEAFRVLAEQKHIAYEVVWEGEGKEGGFDADKLEKVLNNLLSNAVKYTPEGGEIKFLARVGEGLRIEVSDSGEGIAQEDMERIFDRYFRLEQHLDRGVKGAGIGLSLTRELVELMGGKIRVESRLGEGSRFEIELPFMEGSERRLSSENGSESGLNLNGGGDPDQPLLLIVDDHADIRAFVREQFADGYRIMEAANGREGLDTALEALPDLVISDLMMPVMDGIELCRNLKTDARTSHIPVIMLTALATVESRIEGLETGADDYLNKPFNARELQVRVHNLVEQRRKLRELFRKHLEVGHQKQLKERSSPGEAGKSVASGVSAVLPKAEQLFFGKVEAYIQAHLSDPELSVERLGEEMAMSRVQLFRKLKAITGQSPSQLIRGLRLRKAAELLSDGAANVAEAMYESGFDNPSYFAKVFREQYSCSPSEYREHRRN